jgi:hypothetical protein
VVPVETIKKAHAAGMNRGNGRDVDWFTVTAYFIFHFADDQVRCHRESNAFKRMRGGYSRYTWYGAASTWRKRIVERRRLMTDWTPERIAGLPIEGVKVLRENARKLGNNAVVSLCDADIARRAPVRSKSGRFKVTSESRHNKVVAGFHFVCDRGKGVTANPDGTVWTGT